METYDYVCSVSTPIKKWWAGRCIWQDTFVHVRTSVTAWGLFTIYHIFSIVLSTDRSKLSQTENVIQKVTSDIIKGIFDKSPDERERDGAESLDSALINPKLHCALLQSLSHPRNTSFLDQKLHYYYFFFKIWNSVQPICQFGVTFPLYIYTQREHAHL